jgi:hypothetical protein
LEQCLVPLLVGVANLGFDMQIGIFKVWTDSLPGNINVVPLSANYAIDPIHQEYPDA